MQKAVLLQNVYSLFKKNGVPICYGTKGEIVAITYNSFTAFVVKNANGFSFPVHKSQIKITHQILKDDEYTQAI